MVLDFLGCEGCKLLFLFSFKQKSKDPHLYQQASQDFSLGLLNFANVNSWAMYWPTAQKLLCYVNFGCAGIKQRCVLNKI